MVAQTAPQCFDISLWQLISALLVGGRTQLVAQDVILDVARFVDTIVDRRVDVLQMVPSYLEVVLTYLEQHAQVPLPDLHCVSVTGEALKLELAQRWFAADARDHAGQRLRPDRDLGRHQPRGHAHAPRTGRPVPLGPAVQNVRVYVVDEQLRPGAAGRPGAIVFSGVCVAAATSTTRSAPPAYRTDPHRPGERLYQAGDFGRWRPDGKLEFLGRRDSQVKISGFRIEIGEIENTLLRVPGVRDGAVVVAERAGRSKHLVAFYAGRRPLEWTCCATGWASRCPATWCPPAFHWQDACR